MLPAQLLPSPLARGPVALQASRTLFLFSPVRVSLIQSSHILARLGVCFWRTQTSASSQRSASASAGVGTSFRAPGCPWGQPSFPRSWPVTSEWSRCLPRLQELAMPTTANPSIVCPWPCCLVPGKASDQCKPMRSPLLVLLKRRHAFQTGGAKPGASLPSSSPRLKFVQRSEGCKKMISALS